MKIYVGNMSYDLTAEDLKAAFEVFGKVESAEIIMDKFSGRSKGFAFVDMPSKEEAETAIKSLNETELKGRKIIVNESRPKSESRREGRGGYGSKREGKDFGRRSGYGGGRSDGKGGFGGGRSGGVRPKGNR